MDARQLIVTLCLILVSLPAVGAVIQVDQLAGANLGEKIEDCINNQIADPHGGTCDARNFTGTQTIAGMTIDDVDGWTLLLPCEQIDVTGEIWITSSAHFLIEGCSRPGAESNAGTRLNWAATDTIVGMIELGDVGRASLRNLYLRAQSATGLAAFIHSWSHDSLNDITPTAVVLENVLMSDGTGSFVDGIHWDDDCVAYKPRCTGNGAPWPLCKTGDASGCSGPGDPWDCCSGSGEGDCPDTFCQDANNDQWILTNVVVSHHRGHAYHINGTNSKTHTFYSCQFNGDERTSLNGVYVEEGSFRWYGGGGGGNTNADFYLQGTADNILISGPDIEKSAKLLETTAGSTGWPVLLEGFRWASGSLDADGHAIDFRKDGNLLVIGGLLGSDVSKPLDLNCQGSDAGATCAATGLRIKTSETTMPNVFATNAEGRWIYEAINLENASNVDKPQASRHEPNVDFVGATTFTDLEIPSSTAPIIDTDGQIAVDTTQGQLLFHSGAVRVLTPEHHECATLESLDSGGDAIRLHCFRRESTVTAIGCDVDGEATIDVTGSDGTQVETDIECSSGDTMTWVIPTGETLFGSGECLQLDTKSASDVNYATLCFAYTVSRQ